MKKGMLKSSMRKWIFNGALAFGGSALATTGFATWIIGVNESSNEQNPGVNLDTFSNESLELILELDETLLTLKEAEPIDGSIIRTEGIDSIEPNAMKLKVKEGRFLINVGKGYLKKLYENKKTIVGIDFSFPYVDIPTNEIAPQTNNNKVNFSSNDYISDVLDGIKFDESHQDYQYKRKRNADGYWEYIDTPVDIKFDKSTLLQLDAIRKGDAEESLDLYSKYLSRYVDDPNQENPVYGSNDRCLEFRWGSFFGGVSPGNYYNGVYDAAMAATDPVYGIPENTRPKDFNAKVIDAMNKETSKFVSMLGLQEGVVADKKAYAKITLRADIKIGDYIDPSTIVEDIK